MKSKKISYLILFLAILFIAIFMPVNVKAKALNPNLILGVQEFRQNTVPANMAYGINDPDRNGTLDDMVGAKIWKLVKFNSLGDSTYDDKTAFYCVKAGVGFANTGDKATYDVSYDFKKERDAILQRSDPHLTSIVNTENDVYYNLMAIADLLYIPGVSSEQEKQELLSHVINEEYTAFLTDSDIDAVQQAAIWYFTNYDDPNYENIYNQFGKQLWFTYKTEEDDRNQISYHSLRDYKLDTKEGEQREKQAFDLYDYLINTAKANGIKYKQGTAKSKTHITLYAHSTNSDQQPVIEITREKDFDLALRKYITKINGQNVADSRKPVIDESTILTEKTATYKHRKNPLLVKTGDKVTYNLTIFNEGEKAGRATKIIDQLPVGLEFIKVNTPGFVGEIDNLKNELTITRDLENKTNLAAYTEGNLSSETIEIECKVTAKAENSDIVLTNVAWIEEEFDADSNITITTQEGADRDSEPATRPQVNKDNISNYKGKSSNKAELGDANYFYKGEQDDDDFEKLIVKPIDFDLKLIKSIVEVNKNKVPERIEKIDLSKLNTIDETGKKITTADYQLNKEPVLVKKGDIVKYRIRVYNEGELDGYAAEITEDVPEGLEFIWSDKTEEEINKDETLSNIEKEAILYNQLVWDTPVVSENQKIELIKSTYLAKGKGQDLLNSNLITGFDREKTPLKIDYRDIYVYMRVVAEDVTKTIIRNEAAITEDKDKNNDPVNDRDSKPEDWVKYEDDEDFDNIKLESFDLALRKFIIAVSKDEVIEEKEYLKRKDGKYIREPEVDTTKLNKAGEDGKVVTTATYNHTKKPVELGRSDIVIYMLRVYNEGEIDGYAEEITDYLPEGLEFVEGEYNTKYGWVVDEETGKIKTTYLKDSLIKAPVEKDGKLELDYKEVPIMCRVKNTVKPNINQTNIAEITISKDENKKEVIDRDSIVDNVVIPEESKKPGYKEEEKGKYVPGQEDDDDFEKVVIREFDLALRKWVTQAIVIENGKETITNTGHTAEQDPEPVVKVDLHRKKLEEVEVKFRYSIRITNEGDIAGYAKEVKDYIPEGLKFIKEDNPGWEQISENVIVTNLLADKLLEPGESAEVEVLLTWIKGKENLGLKVNTAEISKDYNDKGIPDRDSTPDNKKPGEDDIDDAPVILAVATGIVGNPKVYIGLGMTLLVTIAGGIILIKKFVL